MRIKCLNKLNRYINMSPRGLISLFMAILMTPFLSIAVMLVDTGRYNSAVSVLQETMDMAALSTLAEEDPYLRDRWGLHAIDYRKEISEEFEKNLRDNNLLGSTISIDKVSAEGLLDLSDSDIFAHQIEEFSKLNAPTELLFEFGNIKDLIDELEKINNISSILNIFISAVDWLTNLCNLFINVSAAGGAAIVLEGAVKQYEPSYTTFKDSVDALIEALNAPEPVQEEYTEEEAYEEALEEWGEAIREAREDAKTAQEEYSSLIQVFADATEKYSISIAEINGGVTDLLNDSANIVTSVGEYEKDKSEDKSEAELDKVKKQLKGMSGQESNYRELKAKEKELTDKIAINKTAITTSKALSKEMESTATSIKDKFNKLSEADYGVIVEGLRKLKERVDAFDVDAVCAEDEGLSDEIYHDVASPEFLTSAEIAQYLADRTKEALEGVWKDILDGIKGLFEALFKTKLVFDTNLNRLIDYDYYTEAIGGLPGGQRPGKVEAVIKGINDTIGAAAEIVKSWFTFDIIGLIKSLIGLLQSIINTFIALIELVVYMVQNLIDLFSNTGHRLLLSTYSAYNLTCRTDFTSGHTAFTAMNGYKMTDESLPPNVFKNNSGVYIPVAEELAELIALITDAVSGAESNKAYTFSGAELEYMLYGSRSEIANQTFVFFALYLLRFLLDIGPVLADSEVQALAGASTLGAPAVLAIFLIAEPLTDALLLVNGSEVGLIKSDVNISPSGFPKLLAKFIKTVALTAETKEKLEKEAVKAFKAKDADYEKKLKEATEKEKKKVEADPPKSDFSKGIGNWLDSLLEFNYREYCFMLVFLLISSDLCVSRLENLVQMETTYYYKVYEEDEKTFDLKKSYTFLKGTMDGKVNQLLPSLIKPELFNTSQEIYRGY